MCISKKNLFQIDENFKIGILRSVLGAPFIHITVSVIGLFSRFFSEAILILDLSFIIIIDHFLACP